MRPKSLGLTFVLLAIPSLFAPVPSRAQAAWDAPPLVSPYAPQGLSVLMVAGSPGEQLGVMGVWRHDHASLGMAYRAGLVQDDNDDASVFGGVDASGLLTSSIEDADIRVVWWTGLGGSVGEHLVVSVPLGLVGAWRGLGDGNVFAPYAGGHVTLDMSTQDGEALHMDASLDLGLDLTLVSGWVVRFGASLFGRGSAGIGVRIPG